MGLQTSRSKGNQFYPLVPGLNEQFNILKSSILRRYSLMNMLPMRKFWKIGHRYNDGLE